MSAVSGVFLNREANYASTGM